jgi:hypothetical protein
LPDSRTRLRVPDVVRRKALAVGAGAWLDDLLFLVASLERPKVGLQPVARQMLAVAADEG